MEKIITTNGHNDFLQDGAPHCNVRRDFLDTERGIKRKPTESPEESQSWWTAMLLSCQIVSLCMCNVTILVFYYLVHTWGSVFYIWSTKAIIILLILQVQETPLLTFDALIPLISTFRRTQKLNYTFFHWGPKPRRVELIHLQYFQKIGPIRASRKERNLERIRFTKWR